MKNTIVLFNPRPSRYGNPVGTPLGLLSICRNLKRHCFNIKIYCSWIDKDYKEKILEDCKEALCFGVTSMTGYQIVEGLEMSEKVKERYPGIPVIWGGYHPTILPEQTVRNSYINIVVRGQGEVTFKELIEAFYEKKDWRNIKGTIYKMGGNIISNPDREFEDINNFEDMPYELLDMEKYIHVSRIGLRTIEYVSSQGCTFDCRFCVEPKIYGRKWYALKAERVVNEIEKLVKNYGVDSLLLQDTNFFLDEDRVVRICEGLISRGTKINWGDANGRAPQIVRYDRKSWGLIKKSGCRNILIGAESGLQCVLDSLGKKARTEDNIESADICARYGISVTYSMMVGLPPDEKQGVTTRDELEAIISLSRKIISGSKSHIIMIFAYTPYPGTVLYEKSLESGFDPPTCLEDWGGIEFHTHSTPWMLKRDIYFIDYLTNFIFRYVSSSNWEYIKRQRRFVKKMGLILLYIVANTRWKTKCFRFLLDYQLYKMILKVRGKGK